MGQLEKYGLYVLCLLIFLILGVTLWGSGSVEAHKKGLVSPTPNLNAGGPAGNEVQRSQKRGQQRSQLGNGAQERVDRSEGGAGGVTQVPNFRELLTPGPGPKKPASPGVASDASPAAGGQPGNDDPTKVPPITDPPAPAPVERPTYTILRGDTFESIAREQFGLRSLHTEISRLKSRQDPRKLRPGKKIMMPTQAEVDALLGQRLAAKAGVKVGGSYTIRRGDTLIGIAKARLGSEQRVAEIKALNPGVNPSNLRIGASIRLPAK